jgi:hypothetical protein
MSRISLWVVAAAVAACGVVGYAIGRREMSTPKYLYHWSSTGNVYRVDVETGEVVWGSSSGWTKGG